MYYLSLLFVILPRLSFVLSGTLINLPIMYLRFVLFLFIKKIRKSDVAWKFEFMYEGRKLSIQLFEGSPDIAALKEIFIDGEYSWDAISNPKIILDLGAHTGNTALYFHHKFPDAIIYAVEASPRTYGRLIENVKNIPNIRPIFGAISDVDGTVAFYESQSSLGSSLYIREGAVSKVEVPSFTLETFFKNNGLGKVDFIKIDIEGSEEKIFTQKLPEAFSYSYIIEVHNDLMIEKIDFTKKYFDNFQTNTFPLKDGGRYLLYARL